MEAVTLLIAAIASSLVFFLTPVYGLIVYVATFAWYPTYLTVPVGTIDFTVRRIVILAIFLKLFLLTDMTKRFRFILLDKCVIIYFAAQFLAGVMNSSPFRPFIENRCGAILDMVLPYFAVRMIIQNKRQYLTLLKGVLILAVPLAIIGLYQSLTGDNPLALFRQYYAWQTHGGSLTPRWGMHRAEVVFPHPIMFGLFFAIFGPICAGLLRNVKRYRNLCIIGCILMGIGTFSSMSSGPWLAFFLAVLFIVSYRWRKYWKPVVISIIVMCGVVEIISNRHFYDVLADYSLSPANAWYRTRLIDVAIFEGGMTGHWLTGFPLGGDPGWGPKIVGYDFTDIVNHYIGILCGFGLVGFIPFISMNVVAIKNIVDAYKASILDSEKWLIWCLSASLFGLAAAFMTVSIYGPPITVYYMMIGFCGVMPTIVEKQGYLRELRTDVILPNYGESLLSF